MKPSIIDTGMGYVVTFHDAAGGEVITFVLESVENTAWGTMATTTVRSNIVGARGLTGGYLTTERVNLLSSKGRADLGRRIDALVPAPPSAAHVDWERVVEQVALLVMEQERRPVVPVNLSTRPVPSAQRYLIPSLVPVNKATILYGAGGTGKGWLASAIAAAVQSGTGWLGWRVEQANVLYCDWESDEDDAVTRIAMTSAGMGLSSPAPVHYARFISPLERHQNDVAAMVKSLDIGLLVIDSTGAAMAGSSGGDQANEAIRFFKLLRTLGCSVVAIDHIAGEDQKKAHGAAKPYGSVFKWNMARNAFELGAQSEEGEVPQRLLVRHRKNNLGPKLPAFGLEATWGPSWMRYERSVVAAVPATSVEDRVYDAIQSGPGMARDITAVLNEDPDEREVNEYEVRQAINALRADGVVKVWDDGRVSLSTYDEAEQLTMEVEA